VGVLSRRLLIALAALAVASFALWISSPTEELEEPTEAPAPAGTWPPWKAELLEPPTLVARVPAEILARGPVVDVELRGDTVFLLQNTQWLAAWRRGSRGPYPAVATAGPGGVGRGLGRLGRAVAFDVVDGYVYVLDGARREITTWTLGGELVSVRALARRPADESPWLQRLAERLQVDGLRRAYVAVQGGSSRGPTEWLLLRYTLGHDARAAPPETIFREPVGAAPGGALVAPSFSVTSAARLLIGVAADYRLIWLDDRGHQERATRRADPPRAAVPDSIRREYGRLLRRLPRSARDAYRLPRYWPPLRRLHLRADGTILAVTQSGTEEVHVELLDHAGQAVARLTEIPLPEPVFLCEEGYLWLHQELQSTDVLLRRLRRRGAS
jgi:hypothetical protein